MGRRTLRLAVALSVLAVFTTGWVDEPALAVPTCFGRPATIVVRTLPNENREITGTSGDDVIVGGAGDDIIFGDLGDDRICGRRGRDVVYGWEGNDSLAGARGWDRLYAETGNDVLHGGAGRDVLAGGLGGTLKTGRSLNYLGQPAENRKMCSLYLSLMDRMGVELDHFGDADEPLAEV